MKVRVGDLRQWGKDVPKTKTLPLSLKDREGKDVNREVKIKQYLNVEEKLELLYLAYSVAINNFSEELSNEGTVLNNVYGINYYQFYITYTVYLIKYYTDVSLPENVVDAYNLIKQINLDELLLKEIPKRELDELEIIKNKFLQTRIDEIDKQVDISIILKEFFDGVLQTLPNKKTLEKYMDMLYEDK